MKPSTPLIIAILLLIGGILWWGASDRGGGIPIQFVDAVSGAPIARQRIEIRDSSAVCPPNAYCVQPALFEGTTDADGRVRVPPAAFGGNQFNVSIEGYYLTGPVQKSYNPIRDAAHNLSTNPNEYNILYESGELYRFDYLTDSIVLNVQPLRR